MKSFIDIEHALSGQPSRLGVPLLRIDRGQGREALFRDQQPQILRGLEQSTRIASITASNAIENIIVEPDRAVRIANSASEMRFRGRNEEEFAGYRDALDELIAGFGQETPTVPWMLHIHRMLYKYSGGGGGRLKLDQNEIVEYIDGARRVIFTPPSPGETEWMLPELFARYDDAVNDEVAHPLLLIGTFVLDFLAIHPVADGNGRLSRLITLHLLLRSGYNVTRYVSIEQRVHDSKGEYYDALRASQRHWHEGKHDVWPFVTYLTGVVARAYDDFEQRVAAASSRPGSKQDQVRAYVLTQGPPEFGIRDVELALPGISRQSISLVLRELRKDGRLNATGAGRGARWERAD